MNRIIISILFSFVFLSLSSQGYSQEAKADIFAKFKRFTTDQGLSNNKVTCIVQDVNGYLWLGTANGLNKFDGQNFRHYYPDSVKHLPGATIMDLTNDLNGQLWVASTLGVARYNRKNDTFTPIETTLPDQHIRSLMVDKENQIWMHSAKDYLLCFNQKNKSLKYWKTDNVKQAYYLYDALFQASSGLIYFGGRQCGPFVFNPKTEEIKSCNNYSIRGISDATSFYEDNAGKLWMCAIDGLFSFANGRLKKEAKNSAFQLLTDQKGHFWLASGNGLYRYDQHSKDRNLFLHNEDIEHSISSNYINCILEDEAGNIWLGSNNGLNLYLPENDWLIHIDHHAGIENTLSSNHISCAIQLHDGEVWLGSKSKGINRIDLKTLSIKQVKKSKGKLASDNISDFYQDKEGLLWIGLWSGTGFQRYDKTKDHYQLIVQNTNNTHQDWYNDFITADNGNLWVASWGGFGLMKMNKSTLALPKTRKDNPYIAKMPSRLNTCLLKDKDHNLYVGTSDTGLYIMNEETETVHTYRNSYPENDSLWGTPIQAMTLDTEERLWVAAKGLNLFDKATKTFSHYLVGDSFKNLSIQSILLGNDKRLWLGTNQGIIIFDTESKNHQILHIGNKLPYNKFSKAAVLLQDGRMLFGGEKGALLFHPQQLLDHRAPPHCIRIVRITEFDKELYHDATITDTYHFDHTNKHLTFHLADLGGFCQMEQQYQYKIDGFHNDWLSTEPMQQSITISNLRHGEYTLLIKEKHTENSTSKFYVVKTPAFYETIIFWVLVGLSVIGSVFYYLFIQHHRVVAENKAIVTQQRLLRLQMNPHFIFNAISAIQNDILKNPPKESVKHLSRFASLIRLFMESSKSDWVEFNKEIKFLTNYMEIQQLRYSNKFSFSIEIDKNIDRNNIMIPPLVSQPLVENAIEHGIKQKKNGGNITLICKQKDRCLLFEIMDNGTGLDNVKLREHHEPFALEATQKRLKFIHQRNKTEYLFVLKNRTDTQGVVVQYTVPFKNEF